MARRDAINLVVGDCFLISTLKQPRMQQRPSMIIFITIIMKDLPVP